MFYLSYKFICAIYKVNITHKSHCTHSFVTYFNSLFSDNSQVANIDVKRETPVDHGEIICFSIYSGPEADFGNGKSCIWVDVLDGGGRDILVEFAPFFEDPLIKKVFFYFMVLLILSNFCLA